MKTITKDNLRELLINAESDVSTKEIEAIPLMSSCSCNNAQHRPLISKADIQKIDQVKKEEIA